MLLEERLRIALPSVPSLNNRTGKLEDFSEHEERHGFHGTGVYLVLSGGAYQQLEGWNKSIITVLQISSPSFKKKRGSVEVEQ